MRLAAVRQLAARLGACPATFPASTVVHSYSKLVGGEAAAFFESLGPDSCIETDVGFSGITGTLKDENGKTLQEDPEHE